MFLASCVRNIAQTSQKTLENGWNQIFNIMSYFCESGSKDAQIISKQILGLFFDNLVALLPYLIEEPASILILCIQMIKSQDEDISAEGMIYYRKTLTIFSQILSIEVPDNNKDLRLSEEDINKLKPKFQEKFSKKDFFKSKKSK